MGYKTKRIMNFRYDRCEDAENKLQKMAAKGLFLDTCGSFLWTFKKGEPQKLKYTIAYFSEGSVFNSDMSDNQQTYIEYAKAAGWNFVTQLGQMQIFSSEFDNPIPFETDEKEKLSNIKKCMNKSFVPSMVVMILVLALNLIVQFMSFQMNPIDYLSDSIRLTSGSMMLGALLCQVYSLMTYFLWVKRCERSIATVGACVKSSGLLYKIVDYGFLVFLFGHLGYLLVILTMKISSLGMVLFVAQMPILMIVFWSSIRYLKKKKASASVNKMISYAVLVFSSFAYIALLVVFIMRFDFDISKESNYRTVDWKLTETETREYRLYSDEIPLTVKDLLGEVDYDYYSYENKIDSTFLLSKKVYLQEVLPAKEAPPWIEYEILETRFDFVYQQAKEQLLEVPKWRDHKSFERIDNELFGTVEAFQCFYGDVPKGEYVLCYMHKIITINIEKPLTAEQISIVKEKLTFQ